jgi:ElaB/YqjD/DUF883 family membrane-anchored ribosome-binding protein
MEKEIKDALNFVIGAASALKSESEKFVTQIESEFKKLSDRGAQDNSEVALNARKYTEEAVREFEKVLGEARTKFEEAREQIKKVIPEQK